jgi:hypothetical protein
MGATACRRAFGHHDHRTGAASRPRGRASRAPGHLCLLTTLLDILTAIGLGAACGLRPFVPALAAGALAAANATIDFDHTGYAFLEAPGWLLAMAVGLAAAILLARFVPEYGLWVAGLVIGGLLGAGTLQDHHHSAVIGWVAGVLCAVLAAAAASDLLGRVRGRLDKQAAAALPLYAEAAALLVAVAAVLVPPLSIVAIGFLAWLLQGGRRRAGEKYAGLRVLR